MWRAAGKREGKAAAELALSSPEASEHVKKKIPTLYHLRGIKLRCVVYLHGLTES